MRRILRVCSNDEWVELRTNSGLGENQCRCPKRGVLQAMEPRKTESLTQMKIDNRTSMDWSTRSIPPTMRGDYFAETLSSSLCPMRVVLPKTEVFSADMTAVELGPVLV